MLRFIMADTVCKGKTDRQTKEYIVLKDVTWHP